MFVQRVEAGERREILVVVRFLGDGWHELLLSGTGGWGGGGGGGGGGGV